jgi:hypothetical protein
MIFTQGSTSMHWSMSGDDPSNTLSVHSCGPKIARLTSFVIRYFSAAYTFSSTLADVVTATELVTQGDEGGSFANTQYSATTSTQSVVYTYTSGEATWYPIPITGGLEKLSITPAATLGSSTSTPTGTGTAVSSVSSGAAQAQGPKTWAVVAVVGSVGGFIIS